jgi:hypothetical protein
MSRKDNQLLIFSGFSSLHSNIHSEDSFLINLHISLTTDQTCLLKTKSFLVSQSPLTTATIIMLVTQYFFLSNHFPATDKYSVPIS